MNSYSGHLREKERKRAAALDRPGEPIALTFGEDVVVLTKQSMQWDYPVGFDVAGHVRDVPFGQKFKSLYKVEHNGTHRGWIVCPAGFGKPWCLSPLQHDGRPDIYGSHAIAKRKGDGARDFLASQVPALVREGRLGTLPEQEEAERLRLAIHERARKEEQRRAERIRQENDVKRALLREALADRIDVLQGLLKRQILSNHETEIVSQMIAEASTKFHQLGENR